MPDKFGWCSVEHDGPPKYRGWYLVTDRSDVTLAGGCAWSTRFWSDRNWASDTDPKFYLLCPSKEAFELPPKPQPCPVCRNEPELCSRGGQDKNGIPTSMYYVKCTRNVSLGACLFGPETGSKERAITFWNALRYVQERKE